MKPNQKYISKKTGKVLMLISFNNRKTIFKDLENNTLLSFETDIIVKAIAKKSIYLVTHKSKPKGKYKHPEWLEKYLIERDKIIDAENQHKATICK